MERKSINFELKDLDTSKRTAVIAHAVYDNIDRGGDVSRKGMFTKSWSEHKDDISFYLNHDDEQAPGKVVDVFEDNRKAYTKAWLGTHTLGNDTLIMMDEGIIKKASFGYIPEKKGYIDVKGRKVRELKEVVHIETSVLTKMPMNPLAGVESVVKSLEQMPEIKALSQTEQDVLRAVVLSDQQTLERFVALSATLDTSSDLFTWVLWQISRRADYLMDLRSQLKYNAEQLKSITSHISVMKKFCRDTKASDSAIMEVQKNIEQAELFLKENDTAFTHLADEPDASEGFKMFAEAIQSFSNKFKN